MTLEELNELLEEVGETPCMSAPDMFFIEKDEKGWSAKDAKRLCGLCPIRVECADYAVSNRERYGIWGGLTWNERKRLIQRGNRW
jgi:WhiB family transcriptional regulator, redox-sensing transcriptional regulator